MRRLLPLILAAVLGGCTANVTVRDEADRSWVAATHPERQSPIALLTDYGTSDEYVGILKGVILRDNPEAHFVDITHEVPSYDIRAGNYLLSRAAVEFPEDTVFLCIVDPGVGTSRRAIAARAENGMWFVGPDNGLFTSVIEQFGLAEAWEITTPPDGRARSDTFHGRDLFAPVAARLAMGESIADFANEIDAIERIPIREAAREGDAVTGEVAHVDKYGNIITNIPAALADDIGLRFPDSGGPMASVRVGDTTIEARCVRTYGDVPEGAPLLAINSRRMLELAINMGNAAGDWNVRSGAPVSVSLLTEK